MTIIVDIPLPPPALHPNSRPHWRTKHNAAQAFKQSVAISARAADHNRRSKLHAVSIQAHFRFDKKAPRRDPDNLLASLKYAFDGLVAAEVLVDDNRITHEPITTEQVAPFTSGVRLTIKSKDSSDAHGSNSPGHALAPHCPAAPGAAHSQR